MAPIPITVITGFLGSGKTTLILNLLPQLPKNYKLALLKNEFGDVAIDSELTSSNAISGVQELLNGCICCNLVGQLSDALETLRDNVNPDRIVIETSGSAFPATLAMEVNRLARETGHYVLDGVMSVIDVENWTGYDDKSYTAKVQAQYTDLIVLNKWELVSERRLDEVEDRILDLELDIPTPRQKSDKGWVSKDLIFGLDAKLTKDALGAHHQHDHSHSSEVEVLSVTLAPPALSLPTDTHLGVDISRLTKLLKQAPKDEVYRIKAVLYSTTPPVSSNGEVAQSAPMNGKLTEAVINGTPAPVRPARYILNWAFGRWTFTPAPFELSPSARGTPAVSGRATPIPVPGSGCATPVPQPTRTIESGRSTPLTIVDEPPLRMTIMTARYESTKWKKKIETGMLIGLEGEAKARVFVEKVG